MSEQHGASPPRRALPTPPDAEPDDDQVDPDDDTLDPPPSAGRRGLWTPTGAPARRVAPGTPIPPPAVLPVSDAAPASAGRRFSAEELTDEGDRPLPRRSALSPSAALPLSPRTPDAAPAATSAAGDGPTPGRLPRRALLGGLAILLLVGAVIAGALLLRPGAATPTPAPTPSVDAVATYLGQPADLGALRGAPWTTVATATAVDDATPQAKCLLPTPETQPRPADTLVRTFAPSGDAASAVLHQVDRFADEDAAKASYDARLAQLGNCERNTAWVQGGVGLTGLSDAAAGLTLVLQDAEAEYRTIVLSRTGTRVNITDATRAAEAVAPADLLGLLTAVGTRQCTDGGTCPAQAAVTDAPPLPATPRGWLTDVDLPRITAGTGAWRGTDVATAVSVAGTRCEATDLGTLGGASGAQQRTYLLRDDTRAPRGFGVDEVIYSFPTPQAATAAAAAVSGNINDCASRAATAQVVKTADLTGAGTGSAWVVTQRVDQGSNTARFRSALVVVGDRVVYLMANPSAGFDFSDDAWRTVAHRAAERVTQRG